MREITIDIPKKLKELVDEEVREVWGNYPLLILSFESRVSWNKLRDSMLMLRRLAVQMEEL